MDKPTCGSLFSGIGGLDLGFERAGFEVKWQVENNEFCQKVLAKHWPDVTRHGDVRHVGKHNLEPVDCIIGGFPCQPHSQAGERKASKDERDLWPEFYRIICELKPFWVVAENVLGLLSSENGAFFGGILRDLAQARYDAEWRVLSAAQFGASHLRERIIVVAHTIDARRADTWDISSGQIPGWQESRWIESADRAGRSGQSEPVESSTGCGRQERTSAEWAYNQSHASDELAHAGSQRCKKWDIATGIGNQGQCTRLVSTSRVPGNAQSCLGRATHGLSCWLDRYQWPAGPGREQCDWEEPRVVAEKVANRTARLKGLGNAVVVALAESVAHEISIRNESEVVA
jgi:DNA (cytosine-5)-methyltransferase 1